MKKVDLIVVKVQKTGLLGNARPCMKCLNLMKTVGIKKIYYSISPDKIICEKVRDMVSIHVSRPTKLLDKLYNIVPQDDLEYYKYIIRNFIPNKIKKINLEFLLKYNIQIIKKFKFEIVKINKKMYFIIKDNDNIIKQSEIIQ